LLSQILRTIKKLHNEDRMVLLEETKNRTWWDTSIIPAFRRLKFKASLGYLLRPWRERETNRQTDRQKLNIQIRHRQIDSQAHKQLIPGKKYILEQ
jgi:hypothetical protein